MTEKLYITQINAMSRDVFVATFADVAEDSPWVAEQAEVLRPFEDANDMIGAFADCILAAEPDTQLELLSAHPDLAGRAVIAGEVGSASKSEQASAGLDALAPEEYRQFDDLNRAYRARFGFPFVLAVQNADKDTILQAFEERKDNDVATEFATALGHVCRIVRFRIEDRVAD